VKLQVRHSFDCTPDEFWNLFWDPSYDKALQQKTGEAVKRELLEEKDVNGKRFLRYRFTPKKTLPPPVAALAGTDRLIYEQENVFDRASGLLTWKVKPAIVPDKITAQGEFKVTPRAGGGCERVVDGTIEVRVTFIGGKIEEAIVNDVKGAYEVATTVMQDLIKAKKASG
jgi:hypothetical protein